jgi:penicillin G amidase
MKGPRPSVSLLALFICAGHREDENFAGQQSFFMGVGPSAYCHFPLSTRPSRRRQAALRCRSSARPGDSDTVNNASYGGGDFAQVSGPSYGETLDVGSWDESVIANVPGESGQPGSPHYSDLLPYWDQTRYFPMLYSRSAVEKEPKDRLILQPAAKL